MKRRRIDWLGWILAAFVVYGCPKMITSKTEEKIDTDVSSEHHEEAFKDTDKSVDTSVDKHQDATTIETHISDELFGWAPPPPGSLDQKPQWLPLRRKVTDENKKIGQVDTKKNSETKEAEKEGAKVDDKAKATDKTERKGDTVEAHPGFLEVILGSHWRLIIFGILAFLAAAAVAYVNPTLLGIPARLLRAALSKLRSAFSKKDPNA